MKRKSISKAFGTIKTDKLFPTNKEIAEIRATSAVEKYLKNMGL